MQSLSQLVKRKEINDAVSANGNCVINGMNPSNSLIISALAKSVDAKGIICTTYISPSTGEWGINMRHATAPFSPIQNTKQAFEIAYIERG